jgi:hypothetical protein
VERGDKESRTWLVDLKGWKWEVVWSYTTLHDVLLLAIYTNLHKYVVSSTTITTTTTTTTTTTELPQKNHI